MHHSKIRGGRRVSRRAALALAMSMAAAALAAPAGALAQSAYPDKPVRVIVPIAPGGSVDTVARLVAEHLTNALGQQFVVENLPGASGIIGTETASRAPGDGYTLVVGSSSTFGVNPSLYKDLPYDPIGGFEAISFVSRAPNVLAVPASLDVDTVEAFVAMVKARPGETSFASSGNGGAPHLAAELFTREAGLDMEHIPYKGSGQAMADLLAGRVEMSFVTALAGLEHINAGTLKALAVTSAERVSTLPDVPTMAELGYPAVEATSWNGFLAPKGTPREIVDLLSAEIARGVRSEAIAARMEASGLQVIGSTPDEFSAYIASEIAKWGKVIEEAGIKIN